MNPLQKLREFGQSVWYDNIERRLLENGELARMIAEDGILGLTSNPTIFEKAIGGSHDYDSESFSATLNSSSVCRTDSRRSIFGSGARTAACRPIKSLA